MISAISKLHSTEMFRDIVNDAVDILGGAGITQGLEMTASAYKMHPLGLLGRCQYINWNIDYFCRHFVVTLMRDEVAPLKLKM